MRTHILLTLMALMVSACASREPASQAEYERQLRQDHNPTEFTFLEGNASRVR